MRYQRADLDQLVDAINATGYGLTFGLHTRIDETVARVTSRIRAGNVYINRNIIGATVGVQPFGGSGLSGTGPKAGGPLYLPCLLRGTRTRVLASGTGGKPAAGRIFIDWLHRRGYGVVAEQCQDYLSRSALGREVSLSGPVGESNVYSLHPRGVIAALASTEAGLLRQLGAILATGNTAVIETALPDLPPEVARRVSLVPAITEVRDLCAVLFEGDADALLALNHRIAARDGAIVQVQAVLSPADDYDLDRLLEERSISTNTTAAGGNASLLAIGG
jgi:RHH-type transcriptional regulator, proline utilization regulon repressor / proline dehydrogenase / delta 1-pyrroline-5-carboxylate dehydrogenase